MEQQTTNVEAPTPPPQPPPAQDLTRSSTDCILGGVAAGLARRLALPVWLVRALFVIFTFVGGLGAALYAAGWAFIRSEDESETIAERFFSRTNSAGAWIGVALIFVAILVLLDNVFFLRGGIVWAVALLAVGILLYSGDLPRLIKRAETDQEKEGVQQMTTTTPETTQTRHPEVEVEEGGGGSGATAPPPPPPTPTPPVLPPAAPPREKSLLGRITFGVMAIALGVLALLDNTTTLVNPDPRHYLALAITILGIGLLVGAFVGRARWLALIALLGFPFLLGSPALEYDFEDWNSGRFLEVPITFEDLDATLENGIGEFIVDLRELPWDGQEVELDVSLGIGELRILLPEDIAVTGTAEASIGHVEFDSRQSSGLGPSLALDADGSSGTLDLDASIGIGQVDIDRSDVMFAPPAPLFPPNN